MVATADLAQPTHDLQRVRALAIGEALIALLAGCLGTYLLLRRLLRRVRHITATAADLGSGDLDRRLRHTGDTDEVGQLATTFDAMADQLAEAMQTQRRLLSDVSHQLRTPLTVARGHLEVLDRSGASDPQEVHATVALVLDEIVHMKAMVERLLMLGRAMEPDFLELEPVDLRSFCLDLVDAAQVLASRRWVLPPVPDVVVVVDAAKLRGALLNLIDNAVRATHDGDVVAVVVGVDYGGGGARRRGQRARDPAGKAGRGARAIRPTWRGRLAGQRPGAGHRAGGRRGARWFGVGRREQLRRLPGCSSPAGHGRRRGEQRSPPGPNEEPTCVS